MSSRDLASLRAAAGTPPLMEDDARAESAPGQGFLQPPSAAAFALDKEAGANFRDIRQGTGESYRKVFVENIELLPAEVHSVDRLRGAVLLREKWVYARESPEWITGPFLPPSSASDPKEPTPSPPYDPFRPSLPEPSEHTIEWRDGVAAVSGSPAAAGPDTGFLAFAEDMEHVLATANDPEVRTFTWRRLKLNTEKFSMYSILNGDQESLAQKRFPHRDFYNVIKVDTHVHHSSLANQKHFLSFIKSKLKKHGTDVVLANRDDPNGAPLTLKQVFESLNLTAEDLSIDTLDVHHTSGPDLFHRFDRFNTKYNPLGQSRLREIFLKTDNLQGGRYLGELTQQVLADQAFLKYQLAEYRISVYGKDMSEWRRLGGWFASNKIFSRGTRWLVQIPRLYSSYARGGLVASFGEFLRNIFDPMFAATLEPAADRNVFALLQQMVGVDSVDDESLPPPKGKLRDCPPPDQWTSAENPPYPYYSFYIQRNLVALNRLREHRGLNTLSYRPHCGEAGPPDHLAASFLLANGINHGIRLKESPPLQYLYFVCQIGLAMSPIGNSALFIEYSKNPAYEFFLRGLNVSLSTDDPLQFAMTREPLMEEYSVFACVNRCSNTDMCELARNSVRQSGFEGCIKAHWFGDKWYMEGAAGNDPRRTNIPNMRLQFRHDTLETEIRLLWTGAPNPAQRNEIRTLPTWWRVCGPGRKS
jgi:AMP deaminase